MIKNYMILSIVACLLISCCSPGEDYTGGIRIIAEPFREKVIAYYSEHKKFPDLDTSLRFLKEANTNEYSICKNAHRWKEKDSSSAEYLDNEEGARSRKEYGFRCKWMIVTIEYNSGPNRPYDVSFDRIDNASSCSFHFDKRRGDEFSSLSCNFPSCTSIGG